MPRSGRPLIEVRGKYYPRTVKEWGINANLLKGANGEVYFPVRQICEDLGLNVGDQLAQLRSDPEAKDSLVDMKVYTTGGFQPMMCIARKECAWWLAHIEPKKVREDIRADLMAIRKILKDAAEALMFGEASQAPEIERGTVAVSAHIVFIHSCATCGDTWRITYSNGEISVEPAKSD